MVALSFYQMYGDTLAPIQDGYTHEHYYHGAADLILSSCSVSSTNAVHNNQTTSTQEAVYYGSGFNEASYPYTALLLQTFIKLLAHRIKAIIGQRQGDAYFEIKLQSILQAHFDDILKLAGGSTHDDTQSSRLLIWEKENEIQVEVVWSIIRSKIIQTVLASSRFSSTSHKMHLQFLMQQCRHHPGYLRFCQNVAATMMAHFEVPQPPGALSPTRPSFFVLGTGASRSTTLGDILTRKDQLKQQLKDFDKKL